MITLALDASTYDGTVAVLDGARIVAQGQAAMRGRDVERLMPAVDAALRSAGVTLSAVDRIVCGSGPGSFTSLRIAGALGKGMSLGVGKPLYAVSSLSLIVAGNATEAGRYLAVLDAMRGDVFAAAFVFDGTTVAAEGDLVVMPATGIAERATQSRARTVGPTMEGKWMPHARGVRCLDASLTTAGPVNLAEWEPTYGRLAEAQVKLEAGRR